MIAVGGDGTINSVVQPLVNNVEVAFAVIPVGTFNHFAKDLGIPFGGSAIGGGSDHESFLRAGVPATFFIWQRYGDIHVPGDTFDKIDPAKLTKTGQVAALTLLRLAGAAQ